MGHSENDNKIYVFLSHSHHDYEKVRGVRDLLEEEGFRPLMFFLKCLEKDEYDELTRKLIEEEIDSRQRFILCRSKNADRSKWVKFEVDHIKKRQRPYETVDLESSVRVQKQVLLKFKRRSTVFLSYPSAQRHLAVLTEQELKKHDFKTFLDITALKAGDVFNEVITGALRKAAKEGYVLVFLDGSGSEFVNQEISLASELRGYIVPVILTEAGQEEFLESSLLRDLQSIDVRDLTQSDTAQIIVEKLIQIDFDLNQLDI